MKSLKLAVVAISLVGIFGVGNAMAATKTADLTVKAFVTAACEFVSGGELDFGTLDAINAPVVNATNVGTEPTIRCTNGTSYTITDNSATKPLSNSIDTIAYTLDYSAAPAADGTVQALPIAGEILAGTYTGVSSGSYSATVLLTITP